MATSLLKSPEKLLRIIAPLEPCVKTPYTSVELASNANRSAAFLSSFRKRLISYRSVNFEVGIFVTPFVISKTLYSPYPVKDFGIGKFQPVSHPWAFPG